MDWNVIATRGIIGAIIAVFAGLILWAAKRQGKTEQRLQDELAGEKTKAAIEEKSDAVSEAAAARSDPRVHDVPDIVPNTSIPDWSKRH
jgi:hypothetical protein